MKYNFLLLAFLLSFVGYSQLKSLPPSGDNMRSITRQYIGSVAYVEVNYSSPKVNGREGNIWGKLVPYGRTNEGFGWSTQDNQTPWRAGANMNTTLEFSHEVTIQNTNIAAGKYGLFIETKESAPWKIYLSKESYAWGSYFFKPEEIVFQFESSPENSPFCEYLTFEFTKRTAEGSTLELRWENIKLPMDIRLNNPTEVTLNALESELKTDMGFSYLAWVNAASYASSVGYHEKALQWIDYSISAPFIGVQDYTSLSAKAQILLNAGKIKEANDLMDQVIKLESANANQIHVYGRQLLASGDKQKALEVFLYNHKRFKGIWPTDYGLARGYSAVGDYKLALKYLKVAKTKIPAGDTSNGPIIDENIKKLEKGEDIN